MTVVVQGARAARNSGASARVRELSACSPSSVPGRAPACGSKARRLAQRALVVVALLGSSALAGRPASAHEREDSSLPPPSLRLRVVAPSAGGQWLLRIDNEGDGNVLLIADVRLLSFALALETSAGDAPASRGSASAASASAASPSQVPASTLNAVGSKRAARSTKRVTARCDGPRTFGLEHEAPFGRELILAPGEAYVEAFDPRLLCFGEDAALLRPNLVLAPSYGFVPRADAGRRGSRMEAAPFVADGSSLPRRYRPQKRIDGAAIRLSHAAPQEFAAFSGGSASPTSADEAMRYVPRASQGVALPSLPDAQSVSGDAPSAPAATPAPRPKDELAAAMPLPTDGMADAAERGGITFSVQAHNVGERPIYVALRARQLSFSVVGPDGAFSCPRASSGHHVARDLFQLLHHGKHAHVPVRLAELCPAEAFKRPGLYAVVPTLEADEVGAEYGIVALTGVVSTRDPGSVRGTHDVDDDATLVRIHRGPRAFYEAPPVAVPTKSEPAPEPPK